MARRADREGSIRVVVAIGAQAERARRKIPSAQEARRLRIQELQGKVAVLRGSRVDRYRRARDKAKGNGQEGEDGAEEEEGEDTDEGEEEGSGSSSAASARMRPTQTGEGRDSWSWERSTEEETVARAKEAISDEARAVANSELAGDGRASARQLLDAAGEFEDAKELTEAAELYELARVRIDTEQLQRRIDFVTAQQLDDECVWGLATTYEADGRLGLACVNYQMLKDRLIDKSERVAAEKKWGEVTFLVMQKSYDLRRFEDCLATVDTLKKGTSRAVAGDIMWETADLWAAMALQQLNRISEAVEILSHVKRTSLSKQRRAQATFVLEVVTVETTDTRNEAFHEVWEEHFKLPNDTFRQTVVRMRGSSSVNMTSSQREWREWATKYWDERLKSPVYYACLVLWMTWPLAIPAVSILGKAQL